MPRLAPVTRATVTRTDPTVAGVKAAILDAQRSPLRVDEVPEPEPGPGEVLLRVRACGICRTDLHILDGELTEPKLPLVPGHQIVGRGGGGRRALRSRRPGGRALAGLGLRRVRLLPLGPGEPVPAGAVHRLPPRRRLRRVRRGRRALLPAPARRPPGRPDRAAAVRRPDRLPDPVVRRRRRAARHLRLRGRGPHRLPGRAARGPAGVRLHPRGRHRRAELRPGPGRGVGGRLRRRSAGGARRRAGLRARGRGGARRAARGGAAAARWSAAAST